MSRVTVAIIGGGPSGICAAIKVTEQLGLDYVLFEKSPQVGGTWFENRYPGAECDVPSHLYSFSFERNPRWTKMYSPAAEIQAYFEDVARRRGVLAHSRMSTAVTGVVWDDSARRWTVSYRGADGKETGSVSAKFVISCVGALHVPRLPDIPGVGSFRGTTLHTAQWNDDAPLDGKTVAIIGTGASTVQVLPSIAPRLRGAYVFQRSAAWVMPRGNARFSGWLLALFAAFPLLTWLYRWAIFLRQEAIFFGVIRTPPLAPLRRIVVALATRHRSQQLAEPAGPRSPPAAAFAAAPGGALRERLRCGEGLEAALTPRYPLGCKRVLVSDDYLRAFTRPNVALVTAPIIRISSTGVIVRAPGAGGGGGAAEELEVPVDAIIYATGFDVVGSLLSCHTVGRGGRALTREWALDADNFYGIVTPGAPNFFMCLGPNTGLGHNSILAMVEAQVDFMCAVMGRAEAKRSLAVEIKPEAAAAYMRRMTEALAGRTVWPQCSSWYNLEGKKNVTMWPHTVSQYWWETRPSRIDWTAFQFDA